MNTGFLKKMAVKLAKKQASVFTYPVEKQRAYINRFPEPQNGFERSYCQYCCQMKFYGAPIHAVLNLAALPLSLYYLAGIPKTADIRHTPADAVFFNDGKPFNIVPETLVKEYGNIVTVSAEERVLTREDRAFLRQVYKRYPFSWMLWLKLIIKLAQYSYAITKYAPKAVICCSEFSYTAPILTEYCHFRGIKLINVMHGEKLFFMRDTFAKFDAFYVWSEEYVKLFTQLRADPEQFRVEVPRSLRITGQEQVEKECDFTYYIGGETEEEMARISDALHKLESRNYKVAVRPHPRYSDMNSILKYFSEFTIENTNDISIELSLKQTRAAISLYSTVLNQAYHSGITVIVDDVSNKKKYEKLKELEYIMINSEHKKLSQIME